MEVSGSRNPKICKNAKSSQRSQDIDGHEIDCFYPLLGEQGIECRGFDLDRLGGGEPPKLDDAYIEGYERSCDVKFEDLAILVRDGSMHKCRVGSRIRPAFGKVGHGIDSDARPVEVPLEIVCRGVLLRQMATHVDEEAAFTIVEEVADDELLHPL